MSGTVTLSLTESTVLAALRSYLLAVLPSGTEVIQGQGNRVPEPEGANFVIMTPLGRTRMATNVDVWADVTNPVGNPSGHLYATASTDYVAQLDFHGPVGGDNAQIAATMFRDEYACDIFSAASINAQPLYMTDPLQIPFIDGEQQYENRWTVDAHIDIEPVVTSPLSFASTLSAGLKEVDTTYPP